MINVISLLVGIVWILFIACFCFTIYELYDLYKRKKNKRQINIKPLLKSLSALFMALICLSYYYNF